MVPSIWQLCNRVWQSPSGATALSIIARLVAIASPLPIIHYGNSLEIYTFWLLVQTFHAFIAATIGALPAIFVNLYAHEPEGCSRQVRQITRLGIEIFSLLALVWLVIGGGLGWWAMADAAARSGLEHLAILTWTSFLAGGAARILIQPYASYLSGVGQLVKVRQQEAIWWSVAALACAVALFTSGNILIAMVALQFPAFLNLLATRALALAHGWRSGGEKVAGELKWSVWSKAWRGAIGVTASALTLYGSGILYSQFGDPHKSAAYLLTLNIAAPLGHLATSPLASRLPTLAKLWRQGKLQELQRIAESSMLVSFVSYAVMIVSVPIGFRVLGQLSAANPVGFDAQIWAFVVMSTCVVRVGSMLMQIYTVTNVIKWHVADSLTGGLFLALILIFRPHSAEVLLLMQAAAYAAVYLPTAAFYTSRGLGVPRLQLVIKLVLIGSCALVSAFALSLIAQR